jgi:Fur family ferric uptake transcriptional regulator
MTSTESNAETGTEPGAALRPTRQRRAVAACLARFDDFRSAQEIHELLRDGGDNVGLSTVYRTLQALADADEVDVLRAEDGETRYRRCSSTHHHHLVCRQCGRTVEVEGPTVERWATGIAEEHGYDDVSHTLEIFGLCPTCR